MAPFISFEGIEGSGKTTQLDLLAERLTRSSFQVLQTREPGGCPIADQIRGILLHPDNAAMDSRTELLLYAAARAQHIEQIVRVRQTLEDLRDELGVTSIDQVALAWILHHPANFIIILGTGNLDRIRKAVEAEEIKLTREQWFKIWRASEGHEVP